MHGKLCLVTGASSGLGAETARALADRGASVILVGRNAERCEATAATIREKTGNDAVETMIAELSSQAEVRRLAEEFRGRHGRLDVLVNNAGSVFLKRKESVDGIEMTLALNHLAYFLLTNLLLDPLKAAGQARIVNISSSGHVLAKKGIDFDDVQRRRIPYRGFIAYHQSKLANLLFTFELSRRLDGTGVTANAADPGIVRTDFGRDNGWLYRFLTPISARLMNLKATSVEEGARTAVYLATSPEVAGISGRFFAEEKVVASSPASLDEAAARRLWDLSEGWTSDTLPSKV